MSLTLLLVPTISFLGITYAGIAAVLASDTKTNTNDFLKKNENKTTTPVNYKIIETNMKDETLLKEAFKHSSSNIRIGTLEEHKNYDITFFLNENKNFSVAYNTTEKEKCLSAIQSIQKEYIRLVQNMVYENILKKHEQFGFVLEEEHVEDDNSIVLTFNTGDRE